MKGIRYGIIKTGSCSFSGPIGPAGLPGTPGKMFDPFNNLKVSPIFRSVGFTDKDW